MGPVQAVPEPQCGQSKHSQRVFVNELELYLMDGVLDVSLESMRLAQFVAILAGCLFMESSLADSSTLVVHWTKDNPYLDGNADSTDLIRSEGSLMLNFDRQHTDSHTTASGRVYPYIEGRLRPEPDPAYTPPPEVSAVFETGAWVSNASAPPPLRVLRQRISQPENGRFSRLIFVTSSTEANDILQAGERIVPEGAVFVAFPKEHFLEAASIKTVSFASNSSGNPIGSLILNVQSARNASIRFAVKNDGVWYLSERHLNHVRRKDLILEAHEILDSKWGVWEPTGGADGQLAEAPEQFDVSGSTFTDIQSLGFYARFKGEENSVPSIMIGEFLGSALTTP